MRIFLADFFALLAAIAGWYYLFYSAAAHRLSSVEPRPLNTLRIILRRVNGALMFLLSVGFFAGFNTVTVNSRRAYFLVWSAVFVLLLLIIILAMIDMFLTWKLRRSIRPQDRP